MLPVNSQHNAAMEKLTLTHLGCIIDISQYRLLFGFFLLYTDRVPFELLDSAALI
jgi:hypothetical protein